MSNIDDLVQNIANLDANYKLNVLRGLINSMTDGNQLQGLQELIARRRVEILQQRLDALRQRAPSEVNGLDESVEVDPQGQGQQGDSSNPASDPELAALAADMDDMNWRNIVASEIPPTQVENYTGNARKKKTKKKRRKSKKKKKPYEDLIMTQKKRLAKLQKMSEKLSKKMSKTKKKRRKKKVSDSY